MALPLTQPLAKCATSPRPNCIFSDFRALHKFKTKTTLGVFDSMKFFGYAYYTSPKVFNLEVPAYTWKLELLFFPGRFYGW